MSVTKVFAANKFVVPGGNYIPLLPGNNFHDDPITKRTQRKLHQMDVVQGVPTMISTVEDSYNPPEYKRILPDTQNSIGATPPWLTHNNVLRVYAYFKEDVVDSAIETVRMRKCSIYFYTEDNTAMIRELPQENSGIDAGVFLKRMRIQLQDFGDRFAEMADFNVGTTLNIYSKAFVIVGCDGNTRNHLEANNITVPPNEPFPSDDQFTQNYLSKRARAATAVKKLTFTDMELKRHHEYGATGRVSKPTLSELTAAQRFYSNSGKTLKLFGVWDDRHSPHGDVHLLMVVFHIEDNTVELLAGDDRGTREPQKLLIRQCVPYHPNQPSVLKLNQEAADSFPLTKTSKGGNGGVQQSYEPFNNTSIFNHLNKEASQQLTFGVKMEHGHITADALRVGRYIHIYGKNIFIFGCDDATREYYRETYGIEQASMIDVETHFGLKIEKPPKAPPPPHDGFGTEEDSLENWRNLILRLPRVDYEKWTKNGGKKLTFALRMLQSRNSTIEDHGRHFLMIYFLEDDTIQIDEIAIHNSGLLGGRYLARQKVNRQLPDGQVKYYTPHDFQIGSVVSILGKNFQVVDTDDRSIKLLNGIVDLSTTEEIQQLVITLKEHLQVRFFRVQEAFRAIAGNCNGNVDLKELVAFFKSINVDIKLEDAKTILEMYDKNGDGVLDYSEFITLMEGDPYSYNLNELALSPKAIQVKSNPQKFVPAATLRKIEQVTGTKLTPTASATATATPGVGVNEQTLADISTKDIFDESSVGNSRSKKQRMLLEHLKNKINERRMINVDAFRLLNGNSSDSKMYPADFAYGIKNILHMLLTLEEMNILYEVFFPNNKPCTYPTFQMILDGVPPSPSIHANTVKSAPR